MASESNPDPTAAAPESTAVVPAGAPAPVVPVIEPEAPKDLATTEAAALQERAVAIVKELAEATGSKEMELIDGLTVVGVQAQRSAGAGLELLRGRVGDMLSN